MLFRSTTAATAAPYTLSAAISLAISGVAVVLIALAMLAVLVILMGKIVGSLEKKPEAVKAAPVAAPKSEVKAIPAGMTTLSESQSKGDINLFEVDDQTAALIMAIVADATETPLNQLYFRSIREVK